MSFKKNILLTTISVVFFLLFIETFSRVAYYQLKGDHSFALVEASNDFSNLYSRMNARNIQNKLALPKNVTEELYTDKGKELLEEFKQEYKENFAFLVEEVNKTGAKLIILYIPQLDNEKISNKDFFRKISEEFEVGLIDVTEQFLKYSKETVTLLPENGHLSRFGNKIVANNLLKYLEKITYLNNNTFEKRPKILGDLIPNQNGIWKIMPSMPYNVITNKQGFRINYDLTFPKKKQRILFLGDSFTFGPYLPNHDTYPELLNKMHSDKEFINAGIAGYTLPDELSLFNERAKYAEPDIVILQVLDNDLSDFFFFKRNQFDRKKELHKPLKWELNFFDKLKNENNLQIADKTSAETEQS